MSLLSLWSLMPLMSLNSFLKKALKAKIGLYFNFHNASILMLKLLLCLSFVACLTGCYRMPGPDDYSLVPTTNNPQFTRETAGATPGVGY